MPRYGFTGREHDVESGLIYSRARHYDPAIGQFIQRDPIGFAAGDLNLYAYVGNDPYNFTDPSGLIVSTGYAGNEGQSAGIGIGVSGTVRNGLIKFIDRLMAVFSKVRETPIPENPVDDAPNSDGEPGGDDECLSNDEIFDGKSPDLGAPWEVKDGVHVTNSGTAQPWRAYYDAFGRLVGRTDFNAPNPSIGAASTHHHTYVWDPGAKNPRETGAHIDGEAPDPKQGRNC